MNTGKQLQLANQKQSELLNKLDFDLKTDKISWKKGIGTRIPTVALALEYIMEEKGIINWVQCDVFHQWTGCYFFNRAQLQTDIYKTKRAAESALLDRLITLLTLLTTNH